MVNSKLRNVATLDGSEAVTCVAYQLNEVIAIYPITPSTPMSEWADIWTSESKSNLWGTTPVVVEMQSEAGIAGTIHGALKTGALTTTFTASQGLLLINDPEYVQNCRRTHADRILCGSPIAGSTGTFHFWRSQ